MKKTNVKTLIKKYIPLNWDKPRNTEDCLHCRGTGQAPSADGRTECGFCDKSIPKEGS